MIFTILSTQLELLIPLFAIILSLSIPILAIFWEYKQKSRVMDERKLMVEKGMTPPDLNTQLKGKKRNPLSRGIDMLAVALGIITGFFASESLHVIPPLSIVCAILFWLGIANILKSFLLKDEFVDNE